MDQINHLTSEINQLVERKELLVKNIKIYEGNVSYLKSQLDRFIATEGVSETENDEVNIAIDLMKWWWLKIRTNWNILKRLVNVKTITEITVSLGPIACLSILTMFVQIFWNLAFVEHGNAAKDIYNIYIESCHKIFFFTKYASYP